MTRLLTFFLSMSGLLLSHCEQSPNAHGTLILEGKTSGRFEILKINQGIGNKLLSEKEGAINKPVQLPVGQYLLLADCSHKEILITENQLTKVFAREVYFSPNTAHQETDIFELQCSRHRKTGLKQKLLNRFSINMIEGTWNVLIGLTPVSIAIEAQAKDKKIFPLASLTSQKDLAKDSTYFVRRTQDNLSLTTSFKAGQTLFLAPGDYIVSLNGTETKIKLGEENVKTMTPGFLTFKSAKNLDLKMNQHVVGEPLTIRINKEHLLLPNETYAALPGKLTASISTMGESIGYEIKENEITEVPLRSLFVNSGCSPWEWGCLAKKEYLLYHKDQHYPFLEGKSDVYSLYPYDNIWLALIGSPGIKYKVPSKKRSVSINLAYLEVTPEIRLKPGIYTDLIRLEGLAPKTTGYSLDVSPERITKFTLVSANYKITQYISSENPDADRNIISRHLALRPGETLKIKVPYYAPERKYKRLVKKWQKIESDNARRKSQSYMNFPKVRIY